MYYCAINNDYKKNEYYNLLIITKENLLNFLIASDSLYYSEIIINNNTEIKETYFKSIKCFWATNIYINEPIKYTITFDEYLSLNNNKAFKYIENQTYEIALYGLLNDVNFYDINENIINNKLIKDYIIQKKPLIFELNYIPHNILNHELYNFIINYNPLYLDSIPENILNQHKDIYLTALKKNIKFINKIPEDVIIYYQTELINILSNHNFNYHEYFIFSKIPIQIYNKYSDLFLSLIENNIKLINYMPYNFIKSNIIPLNKILRTEIDGLGIDLAISQILINLNESLLKLFNSLITMYIEQKPNIITKLPKVCINVNNSIIALKKNINLLKYIPKYLHPEIIKELILN